MNTKDSKTTKSFSKDNEMLRSSWRIGNEISFYLCYFLRNKQVDGSTKIS